MNLPSDVAERPGSTLAAIVVIAFNRPDALRRLLDSVVRARYERADVPLVISIDRGDGAGYEQVVALARGFEWHHGPKEVLVQPAHLGLVEHFRAAGRLTERYGAVILLEDDLIVSPAFYDFAQRTLDRYAADERVGGVCLYGLWFNGFTHEPFLPIEDGADVFFLKLPYTQGLLFTREQWQRFDAWWHRGAVRPHRDLHPAFLRFPGDEWFPALAAYCAENDRYFCFPRVSLTVGWGDAGTHFGSNTSWLQTPLQLGAPEYRLGPLDDALAVYDSFYELLPDRLRRIAPGLPAANFDVDLNATKRSESLHHDVVLTSRPVRRAVESFGLRMYPPEVNVAHGVAGTDISLARVEDVSWDAAAGLQARRRLDAYHWSRHRSSRRRALQFAASRAVTTAQAWWESRKR